MKKFLIWVDKQIPNVEPINQIAFFDDDMSDEEIEESCEEIINTIIQDEIDAGFVELEEDDDS